ncbi:MAG: bifunctional serine/threonine-protein kinase/formylglycine-generating enzyme family protein [Verrucomicrobiota bacterium]
MRLSKRNSSKTPEIPEIPDYELLRPIGRGGYGEVFIARSVTGTMRAVKIVRRDNFESDKAFEREFEGIQRYEQVSQEHSGLVDVLHVGRDDAQNFYYYVMELADDVNDGRDIDYEKYEPSTLTHKLKQGHKVGLPETLELGQNLAEALGKLHSHRLAHRDVKPSNIIFVRNRPRLADPGLVAASGQDTYVGTEGYVPPEGPGTAHADLYSLGMVLYEMNTGKDRMDFPELPTLIDPDEEFLKERRELNTIICRTCAPRPKQRYPDARALGEALNSVGNDRKIPSFQFPRRAFGVAAMFMLFAAGAFAAMKFGNFLVPAGKDLLATVQSLPSDDVISDVMKTVGASGGDEASQTSESSESSSGMPTDQVDGAVEGAEAGNPTEVASVESLPPSTAETQNMTADMPAAEKESVGQTDGDTGALGDGGTEENVIVMAETEPATRKPGAEGELFVTSNPPSAIVFINGEEKGATPVRLKLPAADYRVRLDLENYREAKFLTSVEPGKTKPVDADMVYWNPPKPGKVWANSLGMRMVPASQENGHRTRGPLKFSDFSRFVKESGTKEDEFKVGNEQLVFATPQTRQSYCRWLTEKDREKGYLDETLQYMAEIQDPLDGSADLATFVAFVGKPRFGKVVIESIPDGAEVYFEGQKIGATPVRIPKQEVGPIEVEIRKDGHKGATVNGLVTHTEPLKLSAVLSPNAGVQFGKKWTNTLGMQFVPVGDLLCSIYETRRVDYEHFWKIEGIEERYFDVSYTPQGPDHPVLHIPIDKARAFCAWLTELEREAELIQPDHAYRLPTDEEWSRMAGLDSERGRTPEARDGMIKDVYPWGTAWPPTRNAGNFKDMTVRRLSKSPQRWIVEGYEDGFLKTAPVGQFEANQYGLYDIAGNVWEYVNDNYAGNRPTRYSTVMRGGSWADYTKENLMTTTRVPTTKERKSDQCGFRVVLSKAASIVVQDEE